MKNLMLITLIIPVGLIIFAVNLTLDKEPIPAIVEAKPALIDNQKWFVSSAKIFGYRAEKVVMYDAMHKAEDEELRRDSIYADLLDMQMDCINLSIQYSALKDTVDDNTFSSYHVPQSLDEKLCDRPTNKHLPDS